MRHKQNKPIFLISSIGNLDNSVDFEDTAPQTYDTEEDALAAAKDETEEYGMRTYVYKCVPIYRIDKGRIRITKI